MKATLFFLFNHGGELYIVDNTKIDDVPKPRELIFRASQIEIIRERALHMSQPVVMDSARKRTAKHSPEGIERIREAKLGNNHPAVVNGRSPDFRDNPIINANYLSSPKDRNLTLKGLKLVRKIAQQNSILPYIVKEIRPGEQIKDDAGLLNYVRNNGQTSWHSISTCRMGKKKMDVVDYNLKVYGVENLRVVDSSIMPNMPTSNTNAPSIVIGEKGADLIIKDSKI